MAEHQAHNLTRPGSSPGVGTFRVAARLVSVNKSGAEVVNGKQVTVVTPVGGNVNLQWLAEGAESLRANRVSFEHIVVSDGPPLDVLQRACPAATVLSNARSKGPAGARNTGLDVARGRWVYALDADDLVEPGALDALVETGDQRDRVWACGKARDVDRDNTVIYVPGELEAKGDLPPGWFLSYYRANGIYPVLCCGGTLLRTDVARALGGWDESLGDRSEDVSLVAAVSASGTGGLAGGFLLRYRQHPDSITATPADPVRERAAAIVVAQRAAAAAVQ